MKARKGHVNGIMVSDWREEAGMRGLRRKSDFCRIMNKDFGMTPGEHGKPTCECG
jgi:hypothetical protein